MTDTTKTTLPTDTINAEARMDATVAAVAAECSPDHASRLRAAWADLSDVIYTSTVLHQRFADAIDRIDTACDEHKPSPTDPFVSFVGATIAHVRDAAAPTPMLLSDVLMTDGPYLTDGPYRAIAQAIGNAAANDGADPSLTVAAIEDAIVADVAAGHPPPDLADVERFFGEAGPESQGMDAAHPAVAALLSDVMT